MRQRVLRLLSGGGVLACLAAFAPADEPRFSLHSEWLDVPCMDPGEIRVTLTNVGDTAFSVPNYTTVGWGAALNVVVTTGGIAVGSEAIIAPPTPPNFYDDPRRVVRLEPGQSIAFDLPTGSEIGQHTVAGSSLGQVSFHGRVRAYYSLQSIELTKMSAPSNLLVMDPAAVVYSNVLTCP